MKKALHEEDLKDVPKHTDEVGEASEQDEQMEHLMEAPASPVDEFWLEPVNESTNGIHDATEDEPEDTGVADYVMERSDKEDGQPAHPDIERGRQETRGMEPNEFEDNAEQGECVYGTEEDPPRRSFERE